MGRTRPMDFYQLLYFFALKSFCVIEPRKGSAKGDKIMAKVNIINCTPHRVIMWPNGGELKTYEMSDTVARLDTAEWYGGEVDGAPVMHRRVRRVVGLPEEKEGTYYIVSDIVRKFLRHRKDLITPCGLVREEGHGSRVKYATKWWSNN